MNFSAFLPAHREPGAWLKSASAPTAMPTVRGANALLNTIGGTGDAADGGAAAKTVSGFCHIHWNHVSFSVVSG
ncbi:hypothetical protein THIX_90578 [Thiomonas sp. X19]|nr:hypothetical protein THIX_90578 [Thiomonas sp. X19]